MGETTVVAIAGSSGVGKTTLAIRRTYPELFCVMHFDDYSKPNEQFPLFAGYPNRAHPDSQRFGDFYHDMKQLHAQKPITVVTRSALYNPTFKDTREMITATIQPAPIILIEGFLVLYDPSIRSMINHSVYLDMPVEKSAQRIDTVYKHTKRTQEYIDQVLIPTHKRFTVPTRRFADLTVNVSDRTPRMVYDSVVQWLRSITPSLLPP